MNMGAFVFVMAAIGWLIAGSAANNALKAEAIERGYAEYCPKTGDWAWKGECHE